MSLLIVRNQPLKNFNTWLVGGPAEFFCQPESQQDFVEAFQFAKENKLPISILGFGSNVLIADQGVAGLVICTRKFNQVSTQIVGDRFYLTAQAGLAKSDLLKIFLKQKFAPALFLAGIPGNVGGGIAMNAGVSENILPREFVQITDWLEVMRPDGSIQRIESSQLKWSYRHCQGWQPGIILNVGLSWENVSDDSILAQVRSANQLRLQKQPLDLPSCGSVFINPKNAKAAQLIDSCGLKGYTVGGAQVSLKHANFIVNIKQAKALDIQQVISHVQKIVLEKTSIDLQTEVVRMGDWN